MSEINKIDFGDPSDHNNNPEIIIAAALAGVDKSERWRRGDESEEAPGKKNRVYRKWTGAMVAEVVSFFDEERALAISSYITACCPANVSALLDTIKSLRAETEDLRRRASGRSIASDGDDWRDGLIARETRRAKIYRDAMLNIRRKVASALLNAWKEFTSKSESASEMDRHAIRADSFCRAMSALMSSADAAAMDADDAAEALVFGLMEKPGEEGERS